MQPCTWYCYVNLPADMAWYLGLSVVGMPVSWRDMAPMGMMPWACSGYSIRSHWWWTGLGFLVSWEVQWQYLKKRVQELKRLSRIFPLPTAVGVETVVAGMTLAHLVGVGWSAPSSSSTWPTCPKYGRRKS